MGDAFVRTSIAWGYRARAACKLRLLDDKYRLLARHGDVLELGSSPGCWSQHISYAMRLAGSAERAVAVDTRPMGRVCGVSFVQGDITTPETLAAVSARLPRGAGLIVSDICPASAGVPALDGDATDRVACALLLVARRFLVCGGALVHKTFLWRAEHMACAMGRHFARVAVDRLAVSRSEEVFLVCGGG